MKHFSEKQNKFKMCEVVGISRSPNLLSKGFHYPSKDRTIGDLKKTIATRYNAKLDQVVIYNKRHRFSHSNSDKDKMDLDYFIRSSKWIFSILPQLVITGNVKKLAKSHNLSVTVPKHTIYPTLKRTQAYRVYMHIFGQYLPEHICLNINGEECKGDDLVTLTSGENQIVITLKNEWRTFECSLPKGDILIDQPLTNTVSDLLKVIHKERHFQYNPDVLRIRNGKEPPTSLYDMDTPLKELPEKLQIVRRDDCVEIEFGGDFGSIPNKIFSPDIVCQYPCLINLNGTDFSVKGKIFGNISQLIGKKKILFDRSHPSKMEFTVRTLTGKIITVNCLNTSSVKEVKGIINTKEGIPSDQQRIIFEGKQLEDDLILNACGIIEEAKLDLVLRLRGGGCPFTDVSQQSAYINRQFSSSAPPWREVRAGLVLEGLCTGFDCRAFNCRVLINKDFQMFDLMIDQNSPDNKCPMCHKPVQVDNCGFNNCYFTISGVKKTRYTGWGLSEDWTAHRDEIVHLDWEKVGDYYRTIDQTQAGTVSWKRLLIEVARLDTVKRVNNHLPVQEGTPLEEYIEILPDDTTCSICLEGISCKMSKLSCKHTYHLDCLQEWTNSHGEGCPLCEFVEITDE